MTPDPKRPTRLMLATAPVDAAAPMVRALVERRLIACGNILPSARAIYRWEGRVQDEAEALMLMETHEDAVAAAMEALVELHPYEVPKVLVLAPGEVLPAYAAWVAGEVSGAASRSAAQDSR